MKIVMFIICLFMLSCTNDSLLDGKMVETDEGLQTSCIRVKIDNRDYFRCRTYYGSYIITPVVR